MSSFFDFNQASQVTGLSQQFPTTSMEGRQTGPASVKTEVWSAPQREEDTPKWSLDLIHPPTPQKEPQHTFFASSSDEEAENKDGGGGMGFASSSSDEEAENKDGRLWPAAEDKEGGGGFASSSSDEEYEEDWGKKTSVFNKKTVAESNLSDQSTDSEVEEITNQPELQEGFGSWADQPLAESGREERLPEVEDLTDLKPPKKCVRQIGEGKYQLPLKMLKHFKLDYIHVATKWDWDMKDTWKGTVVGAWVYAIFKLQDDVEEKLKPKKVIIYVPEYYAKRAYEVGRKSFDDDSEFRQFLKSPQWWKEISDFDSRDV